MAINQFRGGRYRIEDIRPRFQTVATDNEYQVFFSINGLVGDEARKAGIDRRFLTEDLGLYCTDAVLPGSSFADYETVGDRQGITERNPYSRIYDDLNLVFYIDKDYNVLKFFESWIEFINPLYGSTSTLSRNQVMKMNYPDDYKCEIVISKFNKNLRPGSFELGGFNNGIAADIREQVSYRLFRAWPLSVGAVPVSYQGINLLRVSAVFRYDRYIMSGVTKIRRPLIGEKLRTITSDPAGTTQQTAPPAASPEQTNPTPEAQNPGSTDPTAPTTPPIDTPVNTNGLGSRAVPVDNPTGFGADNPDGVLLLPNGKPAYDQNGKRQDMF